METSRAALMALVCVVFSSQKRISGAEVEMRVRRGDDVTLYSDCVWKSGLDVVWFRNCTHENQLPPVTVPPSLVHGAVPRYSFMINNLSKSSFLVIKKVTESDQGLYYCALHERKSTSSNNLISYRDVYEYGTRATWLTLQDAVSAPCSTVSLNTPSPCEPCVSETSVSWTLVFSVCAVCVLLSSICVYCVCTNTTKAEVKLDQGRSDQRRDMDEGDEVCYASLDVKKLKKARKTRDQRSDFSTYSEVRTERRTAVEEE